MRQTDNRLDTASQESAKRLNIVAAVEQQRSAPVSVPRSTMLSATVLEWMATH